MALFVSKAAVRRGTMEVTFSDGTSTRLPLKALRPLTWESYRRQDHLSVLLEKVKVRKQGEEMWFSCRDGYESVLSAERLCDLAGLLSPADDALEADLIVCNADWLMTCAPGVVSGCLTEKVSVQPGAAEDRLGIIKRGALAIRAGRVVSVGNIDEVMKKKGNGTTVIDASGLGVAPGFVDPHTHPVFGGERSREFALRAAGATYAEIAEAGGGIRSTMRSTREASFDDLRASTFSRLERLNYWGVTTIEAKSGYSLNREGELRMLKLLKEINPIQPVDISSTLLAAHVVPPEFADDRASYVEMIAREIIPQVVSENLAESCDVFCEKGAFTIEETRIVMEAAIALGLGVRVHAEQFTDTGAARLAAELGALSADHLEAVGDEAVAAMAKAGTVAVLLPGAAITVGGVFPDARRLLDSGVKVALGTDLNPGTSMTESLPLMMSIACTQCNMTPAEAWLGVTVNGAKALNRGNVGSLAPGCSADMIFLDAPNYASIPYHMGHNHVRGVFKGGVCVRELSDGVFGSGVEEAVGRLLRKRGESLATAESCTGGGLSNFLTDVPGSSDYYKLGLVVYGNDAKMKLLGVESDTLERYGAVSEPVVKKMAQAVKALAETDYGIAVSGVAGPGGGSDEKPVGTVWLALSHSGGTQVEKCFFAGDRSRVKVLSARRAMQILLDHLEGD